MRLLLAPHAPTEWNAEGRYQGHSDLPLGRAGHRQAALLAQRLDAEQIHEVHVSDLRRARDTAGAVICSRHLGMRPEPRLRELHFGAWEGLTYEEVRKGHPHALAAWEADALLTAPPGGETLAELAGRVGAFLADLTAAARSERPVLVVAHRGSLRVLLCLALGLSPNAWWQFRLEPASVSELDFFSKGAVLNFLNDTHHLREVAHAG